jgi:hypothetical protein
MPEPVAYEPPRVERVPTPGELEREILYAGAPASAQDAEVPVP